MTTSGQVCSKVCNECPFAKGALKGYLGTHKPDDFIKYFGTDVSFPCHKLHKGVENFGEVDKKLKDGTIKICRGYAQSMKNSCKLPVQEPLRSIVKSLDKDDSVMSIFEFLKYHKED